MVGCVENPPAGDRRGHVGTHRRRRPDNAAAAGRRGELLDDVVHAGRGAAEDEDPAVEVRCRRSVRRIDEIAGAARNSACGVERLDCGDGASDEVVPAEHVDLAGVGDRDCPVHRRGQRRAAGGVRCCTRHDESDHDRPKGDAHQQPETLKQLGIVPAIVMTVVAGQVHPLMLRGNSRNADHDTRDDGS